MNKKRFVIGLLIFVMVLSLALTTLVGCKDDTDVDNPDTKPDTSTAPEGYKTMATSVQTALTSAVNNTADGQKVNALTADATLKVSAKYGEAESEYVIKFGAKVALDNNDSETTFGLSIKDAKANNANVLNVVYFEYPTEGKEGEEISRENYTTGEGYLYVDLGSGENSKQFCISALSIKDVLRSEGVTVDDPESDKIIEDVEDGIDKALGTISIVFGLGGVYQAQDNSEVLFRLSLTEFFNKAGALLDGLEGINEYTSALGLALQSTDIKTLLPDLSLDLHFKMDDAGNDKFDDAVLTGVEANINVGKKDLKVAKLDGNNLLRINIAKDIELGLGLDFTFGGKASVPGILGASYDDYKDPISLINFTAGGELNLKEGININITLNDNKTPDDPDDDKVLDLSIPKGLYDIKLAADINPVGLLGLDFTTNGFDSIINLVINILTKAVNVLDFEITPKNPTEEQMGKKLMLKVAPDATGALAISFDGSLLGSDLVTSMGKLIDGIKVSGLAGAVNSILPMLGLSTTPTTPETGSGEGSGNNTTAPSGNGSGETGSGDKTAEILATVKGIVDLLSIEVNGENNWLNVQFNNYVIAKNEITKDVEEPKNVDTTISATIIGNKATGLTLTASLKGIVMDGNVVDADATIVVNKDGVTITAKAPALKIGEFNLPIDLEIKFNEFEIGNAQ